nr:hypothetical protein [Candidatus Protofrankia californiensis]
MDGARAFTLPPNLAISSINNAASPIPKLWLPYPFGTVMPSQRSATMAS